ncbi:MAG: hypothetical protein FWE78_02865 [Methanimicrococcus sp.]|nr:hypothetical protein [Methanimicrococcus sp.]
MKTNSNQGSCLKRFDEKQIADRYRISAETFLLTFNLIFFSGMVKIFDGQWAVPVTEMVVLLGLPMTYFGVRSALKGAYFPGQIEKHGWLIIFISIAIGLLSMSFSILQIMKSGSIMDNGMLSGDLFFFFLGIPILATPIAFLIKKMNKEEAEE